MGLHSKNIVITIDGPAGAGKSTAAGKLARRLGLIHLNSGALFRAAGVFAEREGVSLENDEAVSRVAARLKLEFRVKDDGSTELTVDGKNEDALLRTPRASELSSKVGVLPKVRELILRIQRETAAKHSIVVEGRDAGTVVFPDADLKFFLDASPEVRAGRRAKETGEDTESVLKQSKERDERDRSRTIAPLTPSADAVRIDTSEMTLEEVIERMWQEMKQRELVSA